MQIMGIAFFSFMRVVPEGPSLQSCTLREVFLILHHPRPPSTLSSQSHDTPAMPFPQVPGSPTHGLPLAQHPPYPHIAISAPDNYGAAVNGRDCSRTGSSERKNGDISKKTSKCISSGMHRGSRFMLQTPSMHARSAL